jgi:hypothetical protein
MLAYVSKSVGVGGVGGVTPATGWSMGGTTWCRPTANGGGDCGTRRGREKVSGVADAG